MNGAQCSSLAGAAQFSSGVGAASEDHAANPYEWYNTQYQNSTINNGSSNNANIPTSNSANSNLLASFYTAHNRTPIMNYT